MFLLSEEKLENNLYPSQEKKIYSHYRTTFVPTNNNNFPNIYALDCEMVINFLKRASIL